MVERIKKNYIILIMSVFFVVLINSMVSPLYDISLLNDDAHLFYVIGRGIKYGKVPYINLFDHKGLYIFFITFIASLIEYKHIGLFLILYIFVLVDAIFSYKILKMFVSEVSSLLGSIIISILHISFYFSMGAFECETFLLTFITISYYLFCKYIIDIKKDNKYEHNVKYMLLHGIFSGITLMIKPSIVFIWCGIGLCIFIILLKNNLYKNLMRNIMMGILGVIIAVLPCIIYSVANNCFYGMIEGTFLFNMKYMSKQVYDYGSLFNHVLIWGYNYFGVIVFTLCSFIIILYNKSIDKNEKMYYAILYVLSIIVILISKRPYVYYANIMIPFFMPFMIFVLKNIGDRIKDIKTKNIIAYVSMVVVILGSIFLGRNQSYKSQEHLLRCGDVIKKVYNANFKNKKNVSVYGIGDSAFVFNVLDKLPNEKYFFTPKVMYDDAPMVYDEIYDYIQSKKSDFIVVCLNDILVKNEMMTKKYFNLLEANYELVSDELGLYMYRKK